ncbi:MAG: hypothetical protein ACFFCS_04405 [Candidatus Hodarchaeota archaeon]
MIPKVKLESLELSRLVCGTNSFCGISHRTIARDMFYSEYFTVERIAEILSYIYEEFGVNSLVSSPRDNLVEALKLVEKEHGDVYHWICTPGHGRKTASGKTGQGDIFDQIQWCADHNVKVCMPHRSYTDAYLNSAENEIKGIPEIAAAIRDHGMIPGLSTHYHAAIRICRIQRYDISLIIQPLNTLGFNSDVEVNSLISEIKGSRIQILNIKPMAAGRLLPEIGLNFCFNNIKENDLVACGFDSIHEADYDCQLAEKILRKH